MIDMDTNFNVVSAPKTATFQMRINPEVKRRVEAVYANQGLSFTDAINIFIQQSLNDNGLPFLVSPENAEFMKAKAMRRLLEEVQKGWDSAEKDGWLTMEEVEAQLGIADE
jgi:DNA-damage-inducible protein J